MDSTLWKRTLDEKLYRDFGTDRIAHVKRFGTDGHSSRRHNLEIYHAVGNRPRVLSLPLPSTLSAPRD